jgi:hypothetical protein
MRRTALLASTALFGATLFLAGGGTASADPYDCETGKIGYSTWAKCYNGTGTYRAIAGCNTPAGTSYQVGGPYVRVGKVSTAYCRSTRDTPYLAGLQVGEI